MHAEPGVSIRQLLEQVHKICKFVFNDPWFSSLWTLQEFVLRKDTYILTAEGETLCPTAARLSDLNIACRSLWESLEHFLDLEGSDIPYPARDCGVLRHAAAEVRKLLQATGFRYATWISNPNVQYGVARYRRTSRPEDRVYAIVQAFNLRVGRSAGPTDSPNSYQLGEEFAVAINVKSPMLGQMFNHDAPPPKGKSWPITEASYVLDFLLRYANPRPQCTVQYRAPAFLMIEAKCTRFQDLIAVVERDSFKSNFTLHLDATIPSQVDQRHTFASHPRNPSPSWRDAACAVGNSSDTKAMRVLLFGSVVEDLSWRQNVGIIVCRKDIECGSETPEAPNQRLGVCLWRDKEVLKAIDHLPWDRVKCNLC